MNPTLTMAIQAADKPFAPASNTCSRCAEPLIPNDRDGLLLEWNSVPFAYCPRCAARMRAQVFSLGAKSSSP